MEITVDLAVVACGKACVAMTRVVDLVSRRLSAAVQRRLLHPAGITLPLDGPSDANLIVPEVRLAVDSGSYSRAMLRLVCKAVRPGDRVLVIGAGLGVVSTWLAKFGGLKRILALEADPALIPYLERAHALNGVPWVETLNGVPATGTMGPVPFFARKDLRTSSLSADDGAWQQAEMVPTFDLDLMLADESISMVVSEVPMFSARVLARIKSREVDRIAISDESGQPETKGIGTIAHLLSKLGFKNETEEGALLFSRAPVCLSTSETHVNPSMSKADTERKGKGVDCGTFESC